MLSANIGKSKGVRVSVLEWGNNKLMQSGILERFEVICGADLMYEASSMQGLLSTISTHLQPEGVFYGVSPSTRAGIEHFERICEAYGFSLAKQTAPAAILAQACAPDTELWQVSKRRVAALENQFGVLLQSKLVPRSLVVRADAPYLLFTLRWKSERTSKRGATGGLKGARPKKRAITSTMPAEADSGR
jgi:hypothetical protein